MSRVWEIKTSENNRCSGEANAALLLLPQDAASFWRWLLDSSRLVILFEFGGTRVVTISGAAPLTHQIGVSIVIGSPCFVSAARIIWCDMTVLYKRRWT